MIKNFNKSSSKRIAMKLDICKDCKNFRDHVSDSVVCRFKHFTEYVVIDGDRVISCPKER